MSSYTYPASKVPACCEPADARCDVSGRHEELVWFMVAKIEWWNKIWCPHPMPMRYRVCWNYDLFSSHHRDCRHSSIGDPYMRKYSATTIAGKCKEGSDV